MPPNATGSADQGKLHASHKKKQQQHQKKKAKPEDANKPEADEELRPIRKGSKAQVRSPWSPDKPPPKDAERNQVASDPHSPEEDGNQVNRLAAVTAPRRPSALSHGARKRSMSMPANKQQAPSHVTMAATFNEAKSGADAAAETSEPLIRSSEMGQKSPTRRKSSVRFGATILQPITPQKSASRSLPPEEYRNWWPLVAVGAIVAAASFGVVITFYLLHSRKNVMEHCASVECRLAAEDLASLVDSQVSPCDDFHTHVCGRAADKTFGGDDLTKRALDDLLVLVHRHLLNRSNKKDKKHPGIVQLATTFSSCYAFAALAKPLAEAPLAEAVADESDILAAADVESVLRRVVRLSLRRGISTLFSASLVTYLGSVALYVSRGESLSEKLGEQVDGPSLQEFVAGLFDGAFADAKKVRRLRAADAVMHLLKFDESLRPRSGYAGDMELAGASRLEFMRQYVGGHDWMGFVNSLLPAESQLKESSLVLVSEAEAIKKPVDELRKDIDLGVVYILLHVAMEIGRFYGIPLRQATKTCVELAQDVLPPVLSNVFNNLTASAMSDPSRAGAIFFRVGKVFARHPLKQGLSEEDRKSVVSLLININLHVHRTTLGVWPNGSGWQPREVAEFASANFPKMYGTLKVREALRRLSAPPLVEHVTFRRHLLASDAAYSPLLNEIFLPASLRRMPVLYSGEVPAEFDMATVGVLLAMQMFRAGEPWESGAQDWYDQNVGAFGRCVKQSKAIASQVDAMPPDRLLELFARTYSLRVVHRAVSDYYDGYRYASNFDAVWRDAQRTLFRRFCLLSCGGGGGSGRNNTTGESQLDCIVPVSSMAEFYEAFECVADEALGARNCASLS
ncbi:uncharacterized protein [Dermacentor andersoni]|uniref:uncharacterized protein n=1 Tax=Dermacentor andersoni TaxID=34620 RepID=UPI002155A2A9|nr:uncharacterized protein LOC126528068 [Dermacentor andersoni]